MEKDDAAREQLLMDLYSDDYLCRTFGFINCFDPSDVLYLLYLYDGFMRTFKFNVNQIGTENLGEFLEAWMFFNHANQRDDSPENPCIPWFLERRNLAGGWPVPNWDGQYVYQVLGLREAERVFGLRPAAEDPTPLSPGDTAVLSLYGRLYRCFNNVPGVHSFQWARFGFCFCRSFDERKCLTTAYVELSKSGAALSEIAHAWATSSLSQLMKSRGVNISALEANGIRFERPNIDEFGIYRLIAEVNHTLSGRFCDCFTSKGACHPKHETHLSLESDGDYGFHGTNTYERWQLLNFYNHVFQHPDFDARKMQEAKRDEDPEALERYLDSLVPDFRRKMSNWCLADVMFPKIKGRIRFPNGRPDCYCVLHSVVGSEGLNWRVRWDIRENLMNCVSEGDEGTGTGESGKLD